MLYGGVGLGVWVSTKHIATLRRDLPQNQPPSLSLQVDSCLPSSFGRFPIFSLLSPLVHTFSSYGGFCIFSLGSCCGNH